MATLAFPSWIAVYTIQQKAVRMPARTTTTLCTASGTLMVFPRTPPIPPSTAGSSSSSMSQATTPLSGGSATGPGSKLTHQRAGEDSHEYPGARGLYHEHRCIPCGLLFTLGLRTSVFNLSCGPRCVSQPNGCNILVGSAATVSLRFISFSA